MSRYRDGYSGPGGASSVASPAATPGAFNAPTVDGRREMTDDRTGRAAIGRPDDLPRVRSHAGHLRGRLPYHRSRNRPHLVDGMVTTFSLA